MLQKLFINHYAIIDEMSLEPHPGLNIVTGETGAGKSIILGALTLILGERADHSLLLHKDRKLVVEAWFDLARRPGFNALLEAEGLDTEALCCIRREINAQGKSRAFINDTPVTLSVLQRLTSRLVDLHQQFDHHALQEQDFQLDVLDALANQQPLQETYARDYARWQQARKAWAEEEAEWKAREQEADYRRFLLEELQEAGFQPGEIEAAAEAWKKWEHREEGMRVLNESRAALEEGPAPLIQGLRKLQASWTSIAAHFPEMEALASRLGSVVVELEDLRMELESSMDETEVGPGDGQALAERLDLGYRLLKKHGQAETEGLLQIQRELEADQDTGREMEKRLKEAALVLEKEEVALRKKAEQLRGGRKKAGELFLNRMAEWLPRVGMPNARMSIDYLAQEELGPRGMDRVVFLLDANRSGQALPVYKAASGGELSRIMLCIKSIAASKVQWPTMIFDEVDTGTSGEAARQVALLVRELSSFHQILCITHQVQLAAQADRHFFVYKTPDAKGQIRTRIRTLEEEERVRALAEMIAGDPPTEAAFDHARELIATVAAPRPKA